MGADWREVMASTHRGPINLEKPGMVFKHDGNVIARFQAGCAQGMRTLVGPCIEVTIADA